MPRRVFDLYSKEDKACFLFDTMAGLSLLLGSNYLPAMTTRYNTSQERATLHQGGAGENGEESISCSG